MPRNVKHWCLRIRDGDSGQRLAEAVEGAVEIVTNIGRRFDELERREFLERVQTELAVLATPKAK
jgi:hypothetical protein